MSSAKQATDRMPDAIDWNKFERFLRQSLTGLPEGKLHIRKFSEGYSNLTYLLEIGEWEAVLRRPPFGEVPPKAHDMKREYKMLEKVNPVFPLAPKPYLYCENLEIMDKHFYVMEKKQGIVIDGKLPESYRNVRQAGPLISKNVVSTLVQLQSINYKDAGLAEMGKPEGFMERQTRGWIKRYDHSKTEDIPALKDLEQWLTANVPVNTETTIVHNDFKLNNMVLDEKDPGKTTGILDWELSTVGDPLSDLGATATYWGSADDPYLGINMVTDQPGFYNRRELIEEYAKLSGRDVSNINYYLTFGFYKLGVILQQIHYRWKIGELDDDRFGEMDKPVRNLFEMAELARSNKIF